MICCEAPDDATTEDLGTEHKQVGTVKEIVEVRRSRRSVLFPDPVRKYQEWDRPIFSHTKRVMHRWWIDGIEHAVCHEDMRPYGDDLLYR